MNSWIFIYINTFDFISFQTDANGLSQYTATAAATAAAATPAGAC